MANVKTGITLFSLGTPYLKGQLDLEGVIRAAAEMGAEGYEIVAAQMIPSYPYVSDEFVAFINRCKEKYGIGPICYSANMDRGMLHDRDLTEDEMVARAITDIISANKLDCTVMREQYLLSPHGLARIAPYAEAYNVHVGIEIHNPESPITPAILDYVKVIEETGSKYIGFVPDFGCFATKPNKPYWDRALAAGAPVEALEKMAQLRYDNVPQDKATEIMMPELQKYPVLWGTLSSMYGFVQFRKSCTAELEGLKKIMPYCFEMHGKCHYVDENLHEASIPYEEIIPVIAASGYDGFIVTEYEDEGGYDEKRAAAVEHLKNLIRASAKLGVNMVTTFIDRDQTKTVEENLELVKEVWPPIIALAEACGVKVAIENCPMLFGADQWPGGQNLMTTPVIWKKVFEILPSKNLGINYDPSHFVWQMIDYIKPLYEFKDKIFHVHYKDIKLYPDRLERCGIMAYPLDFMSPKLPGLGDVDWGKYVSALTDIGYNGYTCIEVEDKAFEGSVEDVKRSIALSAHYLRNFVN